MNSNHDPREEVRDTSDEARLHEMLCATILGEASADERAEVERALALRPELRAERERLEKTIGLFQDSLTQGGELSPAAQAELSAALTRRHRRPWYSSPAFRIAAGIAVIAGGFVAWRSLDSDVRTSLGSLVAMSDRTDQSSALDRQVPESAAAAKGERAREQLRGLGYLGGAPAGAPLPAVEERAQNLAFDKNQPTVFEERDAKLGLAWHDEYKGAGDSVPASGDSGSAKLVAPFTALSQSPPAEQGKATDSVRLGESLGTVIEPRHGITEAEAASGGVSVGVGSPGHTRKPQAVAPPSSPGVVTGGAAAGQPAGGGGAAPGATVVGRLGASTGTTVIDGNSFGQSTGDPNYHFDYKTFPEDLREALGYLDGGEKRKDDDAGRDDFGGFAVPPYRSPGRPLTPAEIESRIDEILGGCRRRPNERPRDMFFRFWGDNPFETAATDRLSTFSIDVDTASYTLARKYLIDGNLPEKAQVRTEEFVNYFKPDVAPPTEGVFAIRTELAPSLFGGDANRSMLRVAIRGREVSKAERKPLQLTFVVDVSGSMREQNRLELVKHSLRLLAAQLDARDSIAIVTFSSDAQLVLPLTSVRERAAIESAIDPLQPQSSTNTEAGLRLGYEQAAARLSSNSDNRVVLLTDGVANVGITNPNALTNQVESQRKLGIYLNTIGVGMNNHNDVLLEQLADKGDGLCNYVDDAKEARRALVDNFTGAMQTIARDVKVQVDFDPAQVERYRLLGYENRAVADADFKNDKVDAGEVGAGHQVAALYEIVRTNAAGDGPLATVRLRYKQPYGEGGRTEASEQAVEIAQPVFAKDAKAAFGELSPGYRRAVLVAQFAEFLRRSVHARGDSLDVLIAESQKLAPELKDPDFDEFAALVVKSRQLVLDELAIRGDLEARLDELRRMNCLRAELDERKSGDTELLAQLDRKNSEMESLLRELLRRKLDQRVR